MEAQFIGTKRPVELGKGKNHEGKRRVGCLMKKVML